MIRAQVLGVKAELDEGKKPDGQGQKTIFYDLLTNDQLPPEDKSVDRLESEGVSLVAAGYVYQLRITCIDVTQVHATDTGARSVTVAHTLSVITFHLIDDRRMRDRLKAELKGVMPDPDAQPKWTELEQLPYLVS